MEEKRTKLVGFIFTISPSYSQSQVIEWLSEIRETFDPTLLKDSFDSCGVASTEFLHNPLQQILDGVYVTEYLDDRNAIESEQDSSGERVMH